MIPTILFLSLVIFVGLELTPGDAASALAPPDSPVEDIEKLREALGLNKPPHIRYFNWILDILRGDLGVSLNDGSSISKVLLGKLPATLELMLVAFFISTLLGTILGVISALRRYSYLDHLLTITGMLGLSIPQFFLGILCIYVFSIQLDWLPFGGRLSPDDTGFFSRLNYLVQPALVLGFSLTAGLMRYSRSTMIDVMNRDYITTARSKGLPEWRINLIHGFRTALTPIVVLLAFRLPLLIGGSVIVESVFAWPGMGSTFIFAVEGRDYNMVMIIALLLSSAVLFASLLIDVVIALLDPRVRYE